MLNKLNAFGLLLPELNMSINTCSDNEICFGYSKVCNYIPLKYQHELIKIKYRMKDICAYSSFHTYQQMVNDQCTKSQI